MSPYVGVPRRRHLKRSHHRTPAQGSVKRMKDRQIRIRSSGRSAIIKPLDDPTHQIRLLQVLPGREHRQICLTLSIWSLHTAPPYYAISYTWGDPNLSRIVRIDGKPLRVRENCFYAIWQARLHAPNCHIWIDAICINQDDVQEKNMQVQRMGAMFSKARHVLVCIGPHADDSEILVELAREIDHPRQYFHQAGIAPATETGDNLGSRWEPWIRSRNEESFQRACKAFHALVTRTYWTRLWIVQEVALATAVTILCGQDILPWATAILMDEILRIAPWELGLSLDESMFNSSNLTPLELASCLHDLPPNWLLDNFTAYKCSDPRDRIYGLLAITNWDEEVKADYSKSSFDLAIELAALVEFRQLTYLLPALEIKKDNEQLRKLMARREEDLKINTGRLFGPDDGWQAVEPYIRFCQIRNDDCGYLTAALKKVLDRGSGAFEGNRSFLSKLLTQASTTSTRLTPKQLFVDGELAALLCPEAQAGDFLVPMFYSENYPDFHFVLRHRDGAYFDIIGQAFMSNDHRFRKCDRGRECTLGVSPECGMHCANISINLSVEDRIALASQYLINETERDLESCFLRLTSKVSTNSRPMAILRDMRCLDHYTKDGGVLCDNVVSSVYNIDYRSE